MRLKNKRTGEIREVKRILIDDMFTINSIAELNEEWEDYEESKEFWFIDEEGIIGNTNEENWPEESVVAAKSIGNYFETREEAEKTVEKLKAWKRLKDKGFRFEGYDSGHNSNRELCGQAYFKAGNFWFDVNQDLGLLFGGEE